MAQQQPRTTLVAAVARNGVIGADGGMPWRLPGDLARFKALTLGHVLVMGRRTYDSIGRPLPGRRTVVLTRDPGWAVDGVTTAATLDEALAACGDAPEVFVVGGGEVYRLALPRADRMVLTQVHAEPAGDTTFPPFDEAQWRRTEQVPGDGFTTVTWVRA